MNWDWVLSLGFGDYTIAAGLAFVGWWTWKRYWAWKDNTDKTVGKNSGDIADIQKDIKNLDEKIDDLGDNVEKVRKENKEDHGKVQEALRHISETLGEIKGKVDK